eukprot:TRINITY_DN8983_c0_g1_i1.p1 TRINITY_DN8983_c0_g1~~TRINITY_DN8983_c0_g1_i1.p1  ORF type:complete len:538 (-),score=128.62 TRINITY_DN8983_c0_g1_i1:389-2002(-)
MLKIQVVLAGVFFLSCMLLLNLVVMHGNGTLTIPGGLLFRGDAESSFFGGSDPSELPIPVEEDDEGAPMFLPEGEEDEDDDNVAANLATITEDSSFNSTITSTLRSALPLPVPLKNKKPWLRYFKFAKKYFETRFRDEGTSRHRRSIYSNQLKGAKGASSFLHFNFSESNITRRCTEASLTVFQGPMLIGTCASFISKDFVFAATEYENRIPNPRYCYDKYNSYFKAALEDKNVSKRNQQLDIIDLFLPKRDMQILSYRKIVPVLYPWGGSFPHVIKDVMPRVMMSLPYLNANPQAKLLLEYSPVIQIFLRRLGVPLSRVIYTYEPTNHVHSLYRPGHHTLYQATVELAVPHCHPGPVSTGMYSSEIYNAMKALLVKRPDVPESERNLVIYVSRDGGHNSEMRRIDNESKMLKAVQKALESSQNLFGNNSSVLAPKFVHFKGGKMTLKEAIHTFQHARVVFGPHGGGMYNLVFAGAGARVIELSPDDYGKNEVARFSTVLGLKYHGFVKKDLNHLRICSETTLLFSLQNSFISKEER